MTAVGPSDERPDKSCAFCDVSTRPLPAQNGTVESSLCCRMQQVCGRWENPGDWPRSVYNRETRDSRKTTGVARRLQIEGGIGDDSMSRRQSRGVSDVTRANGCLAPGHLPVEAFSTRQRPRLELIPYSKYYSLTCRHFPQQGRLRTTALVSFARLAPFCVSERGQQVARVQGPRFESDSRFQTSPRNVR